MVERWTPERVVALAPDSSSEAAGRKLATPKPWSDTGWADPLLWGSCQGSGKNPYMVAIDVSGPSYKCSCPSRKFPCKHVLGLLFLWTEGRLDAGGAISPFASQWSENRERRAKTAARVAEEPKEKTEAQIAAAAERAAQRDERVAAGIVELERWLTDRVSLGLAGSSQTDGAEAMAARMIDAQAPGVAGRLRMIARAPASSEWLESTLAEYALLHLLCKASVTTADEPGPLRDTVRMRLGFTTLRETVLTTAPVSDRWAVVGMLDSDEDQVSVRKVWLFGMTTGIPALVMFFTPHGQAVADTLVPGTAVKADLHFYPGQPQLRAVVASQTDDGLATGWHPQTTDLSDAIRTWRRGLAADPWLTEWPVAVTGRIASGSDWTFVDADGDAVRLLGSDIWQLLALTGGQPVTVFGELNATGLRPTSVVLDDQVVVFASLDNPQSAGPNEQARWRSRQSGGTVTTFADLASIAAIGVAQRGPLPSLPAQLADIVPTRDDSQRAVALLDAAAALAVVRLGDVQTAPGVPVPAAMPEIQREPPPIFQSALRQLLGILGPITDAQSRRFLLVEALGWMAERGLRLPHRLLVDFWTNPDPAVKEAAVPVLGERGRWLAALTECSSRRSSTPPNQLALTNELADSRLNRVSGDGPVDSLVNTQSAVEDPWELGTLKEQVAHLRRVRAEDPARARGLVEDLWSQTPADGRTAFADVIAETARPDDEGFLDGCLTDRATGVRDAAWRGLARLPESAHVTRQLEVARTCFQVSRGRLTVTPPEREPKDTAKSKGDARVTRLVATIPPQAWPNLVGVSAADLVTFRQETPRRDLVPGLTQAAALWGDVPLATALIADGHLHPDLVPFVPVDSIATAIRRAGKDTAAVDKSGASFLERLPRPWPDPIATVVGELLTEPSLPKNRLPLAVWGLLAIALPVQSAPIWAEWMRDDGLLDRSASPAAQHAVRSAAAVLTMRATLWAALTDIPTTRLSGVDEQSEKHIF